MTKKEIIKRYILFITSLFFAALGVAFTKHGELGVSPTSSVANILSCKFDFLSLGSWLIIWNCLLILGQILILRRNFQPIQLLQVPLSFLFGWFTDLGMWIVSSIPTNSYPIRFIIVIIGIVILAVTLSLIFFDFTIVGTREGTIIAALLTGVVVKFFCKKLDARLNRILTK